MTAASLTGLALAGASANPVKDIGHCTAQGSNASCDTSGGYAGHPAWVQVNVKANPNQKVDVYWDIFCNKGQSSSSNSGNFTARTPLHRKLLLPVKNPDNCDITADVSFHSLYGKGMINAWITTQRR